MTTEPAAHSDTSSPVRIEQLTLDLHVRPPEDGGAPTRGNYRFQDEVLASFCFAMHRDPGILKIVCEWHEDFVIVRDRPPYLELVSVKHRDLGDYTTLRSLCEDGGLAHLFNLWISYSTKPATRLASNRAPAGAASENTPRALQDVLRTRELTTPRGVALLTSLAWTLVEIRTKATSSPGRPKVSLLNIPTLDGPLPPPAKRTSAKGLPANLFDLLQRFLSAFTFDCERPHKSHITDVNLGRLVIPAADLYGYTPAAAPEVYKAVLDIIDAPSRDNSGRPTDLARYLTRPGGYDPQDEIVQTVHRRTVLRTTVEEAIVAAARRHAGDLPPPLLRSGRPPRAPGAHRLIEKMNAGRLGDSDQEHILQLRDLWVDSWPRVRTGLPGDVETLYRLELEILDIVDRARSALATTPGPFALTFKTRLHEQIRDAGLPTVTDARLDPFHILGYAYELSALCRFGFARPEDR